MIGELDRRHKKATIVGAGFAGLTTAYVLSGRGYQVRLLEKKARAGGLLETVQTEFGLAERAAHSFLATPAVERFCAELGVELIEVNEGSKDRFIYREGRLRKFPLSVAETLELSYRASLVGATDQTSSNVTLAEWGARHLGEPALNNLLAPFLAGIYAARPSEVSVAAAFPSLALEGEQTLLGRVLSKKGKPARPSGRPKMKAPRHGMGALVSALECKVSERLGSAFERGRQVEKLSDLGSAEQNLVLCVPAYRAADLLAGHDDGLARTLLSVRYAPLVSVTAFVPRNDFRREPRGVGVLRAANEKLGLLGVLFNSSSFEGRVREQGQYCSVTAMLGGTIRPEALDLDDEQIKAEVSNGLSELFGLKGKPAGFEISRWPKAIPLYSPELVETWNRCRSGWCSQPGRVLFANYTGQVSLRGMLETALARFE